MNPDLLSTASDPTPAEVRIADLPLIDRKALPTMPESIEARLLLVEDREPVIVLYDTVGCAHIEWPLSDRANLHRAVGRLVFARARKAIH